MGPGQQVEWKVVVISSNTHELEKALNDGWEIAVVSSSQNRFAYTLKRIKR